MRVGMVLLTAWLLCAHAAPLQADTLDDAVAKARAAHAAGQADTLAALANASRPDVWTVVEALLATGDVDAARALATRRKAHDQNALVAYVAWRERHPAAENVRDAWRQAAPAGKPAEELARLEALLEGGRGVSHVLLTERRAALLHALGRGEVAVGAARRQAAAAAREIGWHVRAFQDYLGAFERSHRAKDAPGLEAAAAALLALAEASGDGQEMWLARIHAARADQRLGRTEQALVHADLALEASHHPLQRRNALRLVIVLHIELGNDHVVLRRLTDLQALDRQLQDAHGQALTDIQIANYEARLGSSARAMARIERVIAFLEKHGAQTELRGAHMHAARIGRHLHDPERSLAHVRLARAAEARARAAGEPIQVDPFQLDKMEALALALEGRHEEAAALNRKVVAGRTEATRAVRIYDLASLATDLAHLGKHEEAARLFAQARALLGPDLEPHIHAHLHAVHAAALVPAGKLDEAFAAALQAREISEHERLREFHSSSAGVLARVWYERGQMRRAAEASDEMLRLLLARSAMLPDRAGAIYRSNFAETIRYAVEAAARTGDAALLLGFVERIHAVALRQRLGTMDVVLRSLPPALREKELTLQEEETQAVRRLRRARDPAAHATALQALDAVRGRLTRHRERMHAEQSAAAQVIDPEIDGLAAARERLAPDEALVIYAQGAEHLWALVASRRQARIVKLGPWTGVAERLDAVALEDPLTAWQGDVGRLRAALTTPLKLPAHLARLAVVPTGALAFVPYGLLFEKHEVTLLPSVTTGRLLAAQACCGTATLAVGDPASADGRRLPGGAQEARAVGDVVLVGQAATERAIASALAKRERWRALHLACHGLIDPFHPLRSALSLTPADGDDGLWTVSELLQTRIPTDLAVLGACSTGRGRSFDQEGVLGFVHAFFVAGARQVIVSLWNVDDQATSALLRRFHEAWRPGVSAAAALGRAQQWVRSQAKWQHPAYWASWQLWGPR